MYNRQDNKDTYVKVRMRVGVERLHVLQVWKFLPHLQPEKKTEQNADTVKRHLFSLQI